MESHEEGEGYVIEVDGNTSWISKKKVLELAERYDARRDALPKTVFPHGGLTGPSKVKG